MKSHYIAIIGAELPKLTEDQLYKVLVLVKNTTDEQRTPARLFPKNKALYSGRGEGILLGDHETHEVEVVKKMVAELGMTGGYGIFRVDGSATDERHDAAGFICFCILTRWMR